MGEVLMSTPPEEAAAQAAGPPMTVAQFVPPDDSDLVQFEPPPPRSGAGPAFDRVVRSNPTAALLAAAGLGFLAGRLLR
jgi:hypothetical protein